jgi:hypothetical protein
VGFVILFSLRPPNAIMSLAYLTTAVKIISTAVSIADMLGGEKPSKKSTIVQMVVGNGYDNLDGHVPHIALWNENAERLGQWNPKGKKKGKGEGITVAVEHNQGPEEDPAGYILLSNLEHDAICISAIFITDDHVSTTFFGDYGAKCGQSWHLSNEEIGPERKTPKCVWLDGDNSNGLNAQAMSFHIKDMVANPDRVQQYNDVPDTMCRSTARYSFWGDLLPNSWLPFFDPPLEYEQDSENGGLGRDKDLFRVLDLSKNINKGDNMYLEGNFGLPTQDDYDWMGGYCEENDAWGTGFCPQKPENKLKRSVSPTLNIETGPIVTKRNTTEPAKRKHFRRGIHDRLIITAKESHSARELCESESSYGPDTVSSVEGLFCDMDTKTLYPLCNGSNTADVCFDVETKQLMLSSGEKIRQGRSSIPKDYNRVDNWA